MRRFWMALVLGFMLAGCSRTPPEESLRRTIGQMQAAIEKRDAVTLADGLAQDFIGPNGMDRKGAQRIAQLVFFRNQNVGVTLGPLDIAMVEGGATVKCTAAMTGGNTALLPTSGQMYDVTMQWRQDGDSWELVNAEWTEKL
ncbi:nuclear transport factor 2 family protein [Lysobacter sp. A6]|uniref:Nuclear transport factor 2 family protein n=1 Tax=Noviluteimonas lactosilytica TaxID=2888523 RepID=A0ABS8JI62_9GAMM|nr:nuclear transport factor 2 family protein [Lysobacter lactosilyticus]MCC8363293.1 nuclear transport factor 2 family protein [Lysobacter lactosilyticus]